MSARAHHDEAVHALQPRRQLLGQRHRVGIDEQRPVAGEIDRVENLLRRQAWIGSVEYGADAAHAVEQFQMPVRIPGERTDEPAVLQSQTLQ
jgi:hypothetical protein